MRIAPTAMAVLASMSLIATGCSGDDDDSPADPPAESDDSDDGNGAVDGGSDDGNGALDGDSEDGTDG